MKYAKSVALAAAMVWLVGCASESKVVVTEPLGPAPAGSAQGKGDGSLAIYSAQAPADVGLNEQEWRWNNDFGKNAFLWQAARSDYTIYAQNGEVFQHVRNTRSQDDSTPTLVTLPAGSYQVEAVAINCDGDRVQALMSVVVKPGETTTAHLTGGWRPVGEYNATEFARLPCGRAIGWRASETGLAAAQPSPQSN